MCTMLLSPSLWPPQHESRPCSRRLIYLPGTSVKEQVKNTFLVFDTAIAMQDTLYHKMEKKDALYCNSAIQKKQMHFIHIGNNLFNMNINRQMCTRIENKKRKNKCHQTFHKSKEGKYVQKIDREQIFKTGTPCCKKEAIAVY